MGYEVFMTFTGTILLIQFQLLFIITIWAYLMAKFTDPGYIDEKLVSPQLDPWSPDQPMPIPELLPEKLLKTCQKCNGIWKPRRAHHCS